MKRIYCIKCINVKNLQTLKHHVFLIKQFFLLSNDEKLFKEEESTEVLKNSWFN